MLEDPWDGVIFISVTNMGRNWSQCSVSDTMGMCREWDCVYSSAPGSAFVFSIFLLKYISNGIFIFQILELL